MGSDRRDRRLSIEDSQGFLITSKGPKNDGIQSGDLDKAMGLGRNSILS